MAQPQTEVTLQDEAGTQQYLTFMLAGEEYGVDILKVQEIKGWDSVTPLPNTPPYILGVINLRGAVVPIVDLRRRFNLDSVPFDRTTVVIVLRVMTDRERTVGVVVDAVSEVYNIADEGLQPPPNFGSAISTDYIRGIAMMEKKMIILLDIDRLVGAGVLEQLQS